MTTKPKLSTLILFFIVIFSVQNSNSQGIKINPNIGRPVLVEDYKEYYDNGKLKTIGQHEVTNGNAIGEWKYYHVNGKLKEIGKYNSDGEKTGEWKTYHENGHLKTIGKYTNIHVADYTQECEDTVNGAASYYKKTMEGITDKGYARVEYDFEGKKESSKYFYTGESVATAKLAVPEYGGYPVLINQKYDSNGDIYGIDILLFQNYKELSFIIEPLVKEACAGSYDVQLAGDDLFSNEVFYTRDKDTAYDLEINIRTVFIYKLKWNNVKNGEWKYYDENGSLVKTEHY